MRRFLIAGSFLTVVACEGMQQAFTAHVNIVATADGAELTVTQLSEILGTSQSLPLRRDVVDRLASLWVDYSLVAKRLARGDSLLDSLTVLTATWAEAQRAVVDSFRTLRLADVFPLDSATVDSAYRAGESRFIAHVLWRVPPDMTFEEREAKRERAEAAREGMMRGRTWQQVNEENEDATAQRNNGALGVIRRGQMVPRFENVAYALGPGDLSEVTETQFGYHLVFRPELDAVREEFTAAISREVAQRADSAYMDELVEARRLEIRPSAPAAIREAVEAPDRVRKSRKILATFDGGRFTVADFVRWLPVLPIQIQQRIPDAPDEQLEYLAKQLIQQDLVMMQAESVGVNLSEERFAVMRERYTAELKEVEELINVSPELLSEFTDAGERELVAQARVDRYLEAAAAQEKRFVVIPPLLAEQLRDSANWHISSAGVGRVVERATALRAVMDSTTAQSESGGEDDDPNR